MLYFHNPTPCDIRALTTLGVNVKETSSPIGFFGTGFKYALAVILRNGGSVTVRIADGTFRFTTQTEIIRGTPFQTIWMNESPLGFTTELGKRWRPWMAYRELYCNAIDEGGNVSTEPVEATTVIEVQGLDEIHTTRSDFILQTDPIFQTSDLSIHPGQSRRIFLQGIAAMDLEKPTRYTYNIRKRLDLTEDRTIQWAFEAWQEIAKGVAQITDPNLAHEILSSNQAFGEYTIPLDASPVASSEVLEVASSLRWSGGVNPTIRPFLEKHGQQIDPREIPLTTIQKKVLSRARDFLSQAGYPTYPVIVSADLDKGIRGLAKNGKIYLSVDTLAQGVKYTASTLLEETIHLKHNLKDCTYQMQTFLFDRIISLHEEQIGEPL